MSLRVACAFTYMDYGFNREARIEPYEIQADAMQRGRDFVMNYAMPSALLAYRQTTARAAKSRAEHLAAGLIRQRVECNTFIFSRREAQRHMKRLNGELATVAETGGVLYELANRGWVRRLKRPPKAAIGKQQNMWEIHPDVAAIFAGEVRT
jgi:hypothetical protein